MGHTYSSDAFNVYVLFGCSMFGSRKGMWRVAVPSFVIMCDRVFLAVVGYVPLPSVLRDTGFNCVSITFRKGFCIQRGCIHDYSGLETWRA